MVEDCIGGYFDVRKAAETKLLHKAKALALPAYVYFVVVALLVVTIAPRLPSIASDTMRENSIVTARSSGSISLQSTSLPRAAAAIEKSGDANLDLAPANAQPSPIDGLIAGEDRGTSRTATKPRPTLGTDILPVEFSIASDDSEQLAQRVKPDGSIGIRKTVYAGEQSIGSLNITIDRASRLFVAAPEVRALLDSREAYKSQLARLPDEGLVSMRSLRGLGIDLRYTPNEDLLRLN